MRNFTCASWVVGFVATTLALSVHAQMRPGQPPVMDPPAAPMAAPVPDFASEFKSRYVAAGAPRIMLYWNTELSDRPSQDVVVRDNDAITGSRNVNAQSQSSEGWGNRNTIVNGTAQTQVNRQREISVGERQDPRRATLLSPVNAIEFERSFDAEMRRGGARLVDRTMAVRTTASDKPNVAGSSKQLEAEAIRGKADLLLQILFVADNQAPVGVGFDVSVREVSTGLVVTSMYTKAMPPPPPAQTGYLAGEHGFQRQTSSPGYSLEAVAIALASDVMNQLGPVLPPRSVIDGKRK